MTHPVEIKGVRLGEGRAKVIISLMGSNTQENLEVIEKGKTAGVECFELRGDFAADVHDFASMAQQAKELNAVLSEYPFLFTFRSTDQGGQMTLPIEEYVALNKAVITSGGIDMVDIETWIGDEAVTELVNCAHENDVKTVISYHNFGGTPSKEWMVAEYTRMVNLGADIPKISPFAHTPQDTMALMAATEEATRIHFDNPVLAVSMGGAGSIARLAGEWFGSALTFCALGKASAPGQVEVSQGIRIMDDLSEVYA